MRQSAHSRYTGYRFPPEIISHAIWLCFHFPQSLRLVEKMLAARGIVASHILLQIRASSSSETRIKTSLR